jgi:uncharacterized protein YceK
MVSLFVWVITLDLSGMGGPTSSLRYRQHSSWDHVTTQAPPLRQSRDSHACYMPNLIILDLPNSKNRQKFEKMKLIMMQCTVKQSEYIRTLSRRLRKIAKNEYYPRHVCLSVRLSAWNNSARTGQIFMKFGI